MKNRIKTISIKKINQKYLYEILKKYQNINSGRKNYKSQYTRILKNIALSKAYNFTLKKNNLIIKNITFIEKKKSISIIFKL